MINDIRKGVRYIGESDICVWFRLDKQFFNLERDLLLGGIYIPPHGSQYNNATMDAYKILEDDLSKYKHRGSIFLIGDFNARTATKVDYITADSKD